LSLPQRVLEILFDPSFDLFENPDSLSGFAGMMSGKALPFRIARIFLRGCASARAA
jgi:hypothetical protein